jgi:hypothetical protein
LIDYCNLSPLRWRLDKGLDEVRKSLGPEIDTAVFLNFLCGVHVRVTVKAPLTSVKFCDELPVISNREVPMDRNNVVAA